VKGYGWMERGREDKRGRERKRERGQGKGREGSISIFVQGPPSS